MNVFELSAVILLGATIAGFIGSLTGLGGGIIIVPLLSAGLGIDIHYAIGASLVSVIATSSGAAIVYLKEGFSNVRIAMLLEIATTAGATVGALIATHVSGSAIAIVFGVVLLLTIPVTVRPRGLADAEKPSDPLAVRLRLNGSYPTPDGTRQYGVQRVGIGFLLMSVAGVISGLLGIGSGAMKVLAMDRAMCLPFKVSTTTSNFMIGVTAAASAGIYLNKGYVDPGLAMPTMIGVLAGSMLGVRVFQNANTRWLRMLFCVTLLALGIQMIHEGLGGRI